MTTVGLIGCGRWGQYILRELVSLGCVVHVVARAEETRELALDRGAKRAHSDITSLPHVDGVIVATPASSHGSIVESVLALGRPIFVEKPLTLSADEASRLAFMGDRTVFLMDKWRYHPVANYFEDVRREELYGKVHGLQLVRRERFNDESGTDGVYGLAPHDLSLARHVLGCYLPVRSAVSTESSGEMTGVLAWLGDRPWAALDVSVCAEADVKEMRMFADAATIVMTSADPFLVSVCQGQNQQSITLPRRDPLAIEVEHIVNYLRQIGPPPLTDVHEAAEAVRQLAEIRRLAVEHSLPA